MTETTKNRKTLKGKVISNNMTGTVVVEVKRFVKHPKYGKYFNVSKNYKAHDPENKCKTGDEVIIRECRPISKDKHFEVIN